MVFINRGAQGQTLESAQYESVGLFASSVNDKAWTRHSGKWLVFMEALQLSRTMLMNSIVVTLPYVLFGANIVTFVETSRNLVVLSPAYVWERVGLSQHILNMFASS